LKILKILIADDDFTTRAMLQAVLNKWGYEVIATANGTDAWTAMQQKNAPQMLILDWMMPGMDGPSLCRELRRNEQGDALYILLLTARSGRQDIVEGLDAGADDFIIKPYDSEELRARINVGRRMLDLQAKLREKEKLQGVLEMAGAVCHELNQPLQAVNGYAELLMMNTSENDSKYHMLKKIKLGVERMGQLTQKIMRVSTYRTKEYTNQKSKIIDIENAAEKLTSRM
jgi:sigma-B regulation protein RsbU (phosphoserine phosphatase)